jgi:hypothetical protein
VSTSSTQAIAARRRAATARDRHDSCAALQLYRHPARFVAENFEHMQVEETVHNEALWAHYTDAELKALHDRLRASIPPAEMMLVPAGWCRRCRRPSAAASSRS